VNAPLHSVELNINGVPRACTVPASMTLLEALREQLQLTGSKRGCDLGACGCCTVLVDGKPRLSCLMLALEAVDHAITTIEGVAEQGHLHPVQQAMVEHGAIQCGFCTPAMVLNGIALLQAHPQPDDAQIKTCVSGVLCRCTGYSAIETALRAAVEQVDG